MNGNDHRKIRKVIAVLNHFRDIYAKMDNTVIASKFSRAAAILIEILEEEKQDADGR